MKRPSPNRLRKIRRFCQNCGYDLRGNTSHHCPECGRWFSPHNPDTFADHPPRRFWRKLFRGLLVGLGVLAILTLGLWYWLRWEWQQEQTLIANLTNLGITLQKGSRASAFHITPGNFGHRDSKIPNITPLGGDWGWRLQEWLGPAGTILDRVTYLDFTFTGITDAELAVIVQFNSLQTLYLPPSPGTDARLVQIKKLKNLKHLYLADSMVSDAGLAHLKDMKNLTYLDLSCTRVDDAGLENLAGLVHLVYLSLDSTKVTDAGLRPLGKMEELQYLDLGNTRITDAGLMFLAGLTNLQTLNVKRTAISPKGEEKLSQYLPDLTIFSGRYGRIKFQLYDPTQN